MCVLVIKKHWDDTSMKFTVCFSFWRAAVWPVSCRTGKSFAVSTAASDCDRDVCSGGSTAGLHWWELTAGLLRLFRWGSAEEQSVWFFAEFKVKLDNFFWLDFAIMTLPLWLCHYDFVIMMTHLIKQCNRGWKMTPFAVKSVSNKSCFYCDFFFATRTRVSQKNEKSLMLSVLSVLIGVLAYLTSCYS